MTDDQIVAAAKEIDTPHGAITLIHTRDDGTEVPTAIARQFVAALPLVAVSDRTMDLALGFADKLLFARARIAELETENAGLLQAQAATTTKQEQT